jgi:hypothetical protein
MRVALSQASAGFVDSTQPAGKLNVTSARVSFNEFAVLS